MKKKLTYLSLFLSTLIFIDIVIQGIHYASFSPNQEALLDEPKSSTTAGYGPSRQGVVYSSLPLSNDIQLIEKPLPLPKNTLKAMPLFLNARDLPKEVRSKFPQVTGQYLITMTTDGWVIAYDIKKETQFWSVNASDYLISNAPVLSLKWGRIYFVNNHQIFSINIDGSDFQCLQMDPQKIMAKQANIPPENYPFYCGSAALGINTQAKSPYLFRGCATGSHYGIYPGGVGYLFAIYLDQNGKYLEPLKYKYYKTSVQTNDPKTGFNTGIWNTGMGPTLTTDNQILIATGNGPLYPKQKNYGCSIIKLDGDLLDIKSYEDYYSMDHFNFQECFRTNDELGSSSVAFLEHNSKQYAAITGKDGFFRIFDPRSMPRNDPKLKKEVKFGSYTYGQPLLFLNEKDQVQAVVHSRNHSEQYAIDEYFLANDDIISKIQQDNFIIGPFKKVACIGYLKSTGKSHERIDLYYSGRVRRDFVAIRNKPHIKKQLKQMNFTNEAINKAIPWEWGSQYISLKQSLGYSINELPETLSTKYELRKMHTFYGHKNYSKNHMYSSPFPTTLFKKRKPLFLIDQNMSTIISKKSMQHDKEGNIDFCGNIDDKNLKKIYMYSTKGRIYGNPKEYVVALYDIDPNLKITERWKKIYKNGNRSQNTNIAGMITKTGGIIIIPLAAGNQLETSKLQLISLLNGEEIASIQFKGEVHFTMPLVVGNKIFVATKKHGIKCFVIKYWDFKTYFLKYSYLFGGRYE